MAIALAQGNTADIAFSLVNSFTVTLPNSYATSAGDCIVLNLSYSFNGTAVASGCGATWVLFRRNGHVLFVGYNCTAGGTSVALTGMSSDTGDVNVAVFSGCTTTNPIGSEVAGGATGTSFTSPSISYTTGMVVVGGGSQGGTATWSASTWSDGNTNHNVWASKVHSGATLDYEVPGSSSSTTETIHTGTSQGLDIIAITLTPGNTGGGGLHSGGLGTGGLGSNTGLGS